MSDFTIGKPAFAKINEIEKKAMKPAYKCSGAPYHLSACDGSCGDLSEPSPQGIDVGLRRKPTTEELLDRLHEDGNPLSQVAASLIERLDAEHAEDVHSNLKLQDTIAKLEGENKRLKRPQDYPPLETPPSETILMPIDDVRDLDNVVHELGIEDSDTTPAEAVRELKVLIERLAAELREKDQLLAQASDSIELQEAEQRGYARAQAEIERRTAERDAAISDNQRQRKEIERLCAELQWIADTPMQFIKPQSDIYWSNVAMALAQKAIDALSAPRTKSDG